MCSRGIRENFADWHWGWTLERKVWISGKVGVDHPGWREQYIQRVGGRNMC